MSPAAMYSLVRSTAARKSLLTGAALHFDRLCTSLPAASFGSGFARRFSSAVQPLHGLGVGFIGFGERDVGSGDHPDLLAHVIEGQHFVEEEQAGVGNTQLILAQLGRRSIWRTAS